MNEGEQVVGTALSIVELNDLAAAICRENKVKLLKPAVEWVENRFFRIRAIWLPLDCCYLADVLLAKIPECRS